MSIWQGNLFIKHIKPESIVVFSLKISKPENRFPYTIRAPFFVGFGRGRPNINRFFEDIQPWSRLVVDWIVEKFCQME